MPDEPKSLPARKRRRGAQPGNTNAIKDGLYARKTRPAEIEILDGSPGNGLSVEIGYLRALIAKVAMDGLETDDPLERESKLRTVSMAIIAISRAIRTQHLITPSSQDKLKDTIEQALDDVMDELGLA